MADRRVAGLEGPVQLITLTKPMSQTIYFVELLPAKSDAASGLRETINRIENMYKCKTICRMHADRAQELAGPRVRQYLENLGMAVTSTAGYDSNSNGRAERGVRFFQYRVRTLLSTKIRSEKLQERIREFWTFAAQHAGEVHKRQMTGEQPCKYEFGQCVLSRIKEPESKFAERLKK